MEDRSLYLFVGGGPKIADLAKIDGIRCAATLAHPIYGLFVGGWEGDWYERLLPSLTGPIDVNFEPDPIPDYPPSWPTRIVHREPSNAAYHALSFEQQLPVSPFVEEASWLEASWLYDSTVLTLWGAERREDILAMTDPWFVTSLAYDSSEALV